MAALGRTGPAAGGELPVVEVELGGVRRLGPQLVLEFSTVPTGGKVARVAVAQAAEPLGWFEPVDVGPDGRVFVPRRAVNLPPATAALRAWFIGSELVGAARRQWPVEAELRAEIDAVGLGARSVWLDVGSDHGVALGDSWWRRVNGQPVARCDVRLVGSDVCFCRVVPLVAGWRARPGDSVSLWPLPGQQRTGQAATAVSFVETAGDGQTVWVAAPLRIDAPTEPRLDFCRDGDYVGSGAVERRDPRFWYVRTLPAAGRGVIRAGDDAVIRTSADIRQRRFSARVFEQTPIGGLINAGEMDGLSVGEVGTVYRDGRRTGHVTLTRVQRDYSVTQFSVDAAHAVTTRPLPDVEQDPVRRLDRLERLDEVRFRPREDPTPTLAVIERVVDGTLFSGRVTAPRAAPLLRLLAVRRAGRVIGAAILLDAADSRALGFALARSLSRPLAVGDELASAPEGDPRDPQAAR